MRHDLRMMLARQAAWQRSRAEQSWAEKLRLSVLMREDLRSIKKPRLPEDTPHRKGTDHPLEHRSP
ncbi:MAG: hypothetical protein DRJ65_16285 [Acidobacteria bacterium]|nr:MAG: hypothetical protein DRJ65_16285 [Acidobacteriota bacterium]